MIKASGGALRIEHVHVVTWKRHWSKYSKHVIAGFNVPGRAQVNSPAFDWPFLAMGASYDHKHHQRRFTVIDYDGDSAGYGKLFTFHCRAHRRVIQCTNTFGDSIKYRP